MFPSDSHSVRQLHAADMHVAHQQRTRGKVVSSPERRWHRALLAKLTIRRNTTSTRPVTTAYARAQRRQAQSTTSFTLVDASTGQRLHD
jgi:hypothetical protein